MRDRASMPSGFPVDSRVPVTVFEVPGRKGIDDIDACATAYRAVGRAGHGLTRGLHVSRTTVAELRLEGGFLPAAGGRGGPDVD